MAKFEIEVDSETIQFFRENIDDREPVEILLSKMLKLLKEILKAAN